MLEDGEGKGGLTAEQVEQSRRAHGANVVRPRLQPKTWLQLAKEALLDKCLVILMAAAFLSLGISIYKIAYDNASLQELLEPLGILAAVLVVVLTNATTDYHRELKFHELQRVVAEETLRTMLLRDGTWRRMHMEDVVVGDLASVRVGDLVPADGLCVQGVECAVDESQQTGESGTIDKGQGDDILAGSKVVNGNALLRVTAVGETSSHGSILCDIYDGSCSERTVLQLKLDALADQIAIFGLVSSALLMGAMIMKGLWVQREAPVPLVLHALMEAVTLLVVVVPEGLPMAVTLTLVYGSTLLMREACLVRHLAACETMASVTAICTDKTGTLTCNLMVCVQRDVLNEPATQQAILANVDRTKAMTATESALVKAVMSQSDSAGDGRTAPRVLLRMPFSSRNKFAAAIVEDFRTDGTPMIKAYVMGAADILLSYFAPQAAASFQVGLREMSRRSLRCILVLSIDNIGSAALDQVEGSPEDCKLETLMTSSRERSLLGLFGLEDLLRGDTIQAIRLCQGAGIAVRMLTGDSEQTAKVIAQQCGILTPGGLALDGPHFRAELACPERFQQSILPRLQVLARSTPQDKLTLVKVLQARGEIVAVTGDGTNDAPSLCQADLGLVMGHTGTQVAKCASDIILLEDRFMDVVKCVQIARSIRAGLRRFLQFQLTVNVVALVVAFVTAMAGEESALKPLQLLWINLVMDSIAALSMALPAHKEHTDGDDPLMKQAPERPDSPLITYEMGRGILGQALVQLLVLLSIYFMLPRLGKEMAMGGHRETATFHAFVLLQLGNEWAIMRWRHATRLFMSIWTACLVLQLVIIVGFPQAFGCVRLPPWLILGPVVPLLLISILTGLSLSLLPAWGKSASSVSTTVVSREQLRWQHTIGRVRNRLAVFHAIRH